MGVTRYMLLVAGLIVLFVSCTLEKRRYTKGFYVARTGKSAEATPARIKQQTATIPASQKPAIVKSYDPEAGLSASADDITVPVYRTKKKITLFTQDDSCDVVYMRSGESVRAKVLEVGIREIKYKKCSMPDGPIFIALRSEVAKIRYRSGREETIEAEPAPPASQAPGLPTYPINRELHPDVGSVVALTITGWLLWFGSIPAIILGYKALREINAQPWRYRGYNTIKTAIAFSWAKLVFFVILMFMVIYSSSGI